MRSSSKVVDGRLGEEAALDLVDLFSVTFVTGSVIVSKRFLEGSKVSSFEFFEVSE